MNYELINKQIQSLMGENEKRISILSNTAALLHESENHLWTGFYLVDEKKNELYLGPFQGPLACTKIPFAKGVCGTSWSEKKTIIVDDVHKFPGHIACSSKSNSEIVVPIFKDDKVVAVIDIDSEKFSCFNESDREGLGLIAKTLSLVF